MEESLNAFKILTGKSTGKRPLRRWEDSIRMNLNEIGINTKNSFDSTQDTGYWRDLVNAPFQLRIP